MGSEGVDRRALLAAKLQARIRTPERLAPNQARLWYLHQLEPGSAAYHVPVALRLRGPLDVDALQQAFGGVVARHEWLRSRVEADDADPVQIVEDHVDVVIGRDAFSTPASDADVTAWVEALVSVPFDLAAGPPWRAALATLGHDDHLLVVVLHHIACDAASIDVLLAELGTRYEAAIDGRTLDLPAPPPASELTRRLRHDADAPATSELARARAAELAGTEPDARLPADVTGHGAGTGPGAAGLEELVLEPAVVARVHAAAEAGGVTPFALVAAAVATVVGRFTGRSDVAVGVPIDLRWQLDRSAEVVAFLVETAAVAIRGATTRPLADLAADVRDAVTVALAEPVPFEAVVAALRTSGDLPRAGTPLHAYVGWLTEDDHRRLGTSGPAMEAVDLPLGPAKFDLNWTAVGTVDGIRLQLEHDTARLTAATARRLLAHVAAVLDVACAGPDVPLADLSLLPADEERAIEAWEGEAASFPAVDLLTFLAGRHAPTDDVVIAPGDPVDVVLSADDLQRRVDDLAAVLVDRGVGPGDRVVVSSSRSAGMVVAVLAVLRAGAAYVPVDPALPPARQRLLCEEVGARAVVGEGRWADGLADEVGVVGVGVDRTGRPVDGPVEHPAFPARTPESVTYVLFTSGSTGVPKGVVVNDGNLVARIESYFEVLGRDPVRYLLHSPIGFDGSVYAFWALAVGGTLIVPPDTTAGNPAALVRAVQDSAATDTFFVPSLYELVLDAAATMGGLPSFRRVCVGGEVFPPALADVHAAVAAEALLFNVYGPTEVVVTSAHRVVTPRDGHGPVPVGPPHPGTVAQVLDQQGRRVPVGAPGELHLGGPSVAVGYHGRATDEPPFSWRTDGDHRGCRFYATGDHVRWNDDGELVFLGRRDRQVKLRGQRIELAEVEAALRSLPGVTDVAVQVLGSGPTARLVAVVAPASPPGGGSGLRTQLTAILPKGWVPDRVVTTDALPRLASGKLDRVLITELITLSTAADAEGRTAAGAAPGASTTERGIAATMAALLERDHVGLDDDFFDLGGHSLLAARLVSVLQSQLGVELPLAVVVQGATPRQLAVAADRLLARAWAEPSDVVSLSMLRAGEGKSPLVVVARDGETGLYLRHFLRQLDPGRPLWVLLRPNGPPDRSWVADLAAQGQAAAAVLAESFPSGEIHLLGHSASGFVALEAARALGDRAGRTILLDTLPPLTALRMVRSVGGAARRFLRAPVSQGRVWLDTAASRWRPTPDELDPARLRDLRDDQDVRAVRSLRVAPFDGDAVLVAAEQTRRSFEAPDLGWRRWCPSLEVAVIPGDHLGILMPPLVTHTVGALDGLLRDRP